MGLQEDRVEDIQERVSFFTRAGRFDLVQTTLESCKMPHDSLAETWRKNMLGVAYHKQSKFSDAVKIFKTAHEDQPAHLESALNFITTLCDLGLYDIAADKTTRYLHLIHERGEKGGAESSSEIFVQHAVAARKYERSGNYEAAFLHCSSALKIEPQNTAVQLLYAKLCIKTDNNEKARHILQMLVDAKQESCEIFNTIGLACYNLGHKDKARAYWKRAQEISSDDIVSATYLQTSTAG